MDRTAAPGAPDVELVARFLEQRSEEAFVRLYRAHTPYLYCLALRLSGRRRELAEDALQEAWVRAVERLAAFHWRSTLRTWLAGIVINCVRELQRRPRPLGADHPPGGPGDGAAGHGGDAALAERLDVERLVAALPDGQREVLVLFHLEGYTHEEIADRLGIAAGTSKSRLFEARRALRRWLDPTAGRQGEAS